MYWLKWREWIHQRPYLWTRVGWWKKLLAFDQLMLCYNNQTGRWCYRASYVSAANAIDIDYSERWRMSYLLVCYLLSCLGGLTVDGSTGLSPLHQSLLLWLASVNLSYVDLNHASRDACVGHVIGVGPYDLPRIILCIVQHINYNIEYSPVTFSTEENWPPYTEHLAGIVINCVCNYWKSIPAFKNI